jgi:hypothetical protein
MYVQQMAVEFDGASRRLLNDVRTAFASRTGNRVAGVVALAPQVSERAAHLVSITASAAASTATCKSGLNQPEKYTVVQQEGGLG